MKRITRFILTAALLVCVVAASATGVSDYTEIKVGDYILRSQAFTQPTTLCAALTTASISDSSTGATITEASYTGYARAQLDASFSNWSGPGGVVTNTASTGTNGTYTNAVLMTFGTAPSSGPTTVVGIALLSSCTPGAGNIYFYAPLTANKTLNPGDPAPTLPIGAFSIQPTD